MTDKQQKFVIRRTDGKVYPFSEALAARGDMHTVFGTLEQAIEKGREMASKGHDVIEPTVLGADKPVAVEPIDVEEVLTEAVSESTGSERLGEIASAIKQLDPTNPTHFTQEGIPRVQAIEAVFGDDITAEERNAAWDALNAA